VVRRLSPASFTRLLDAACGTGRRLPRRAETARSSGTAFGVDLVYEMLAAGARPKQLAAGDLLRLPLRSREFDLVWCRLALGHVADLGAAYAELARVVAPGGALVATDVHPALFDAGFARDFKDADGRRRVVEHHVRGRADHLAAAERAGFLLEDEDEPRVGPEIRGAFAAAGRLAHYEEQLGMPVLLAFRFRAP